MRPTRPEDAGDVARVQVGTWRAAYAGIVPEPDLRAMSVVERAERQRRILATGGPAAVHLVAEAAGTVVGFCSGGPARDDDVDGERVAEVYALYVEPGHWSTGTGRSLLADCLDRLTGNGFRAVVLWVLEHNDQARRFYEAAGFAPDGTRKVIAMTEPVAEVRYACPLPARR